MTHPEQLLADYVEGTLGERERALLHEHLSTCAVCREELDLARNAVSALATLEERPVPLGVTGPVLAEAERRFERRRTVVWQRFQWAAGATMAAGAAVDLVTAAPAIECLRSAEVPLDDPGDRLLAIIEARFAGTPAYFAALLDSSGAGQPAESVIVWVVDRRDCQILSFATQPV